MRRFSLVLLAAVTAVPGLAVLPVVTLPAPAPRPVAPQVTALPLTGVDAATWSRLSAPLVTPAPAGTRTTGDRTAKPAPSRTPRRPVVLTAALSTPGYQTLGVTWAPTAVPDDVEVSVRTRTGGAWSGWTPLDVDTDTDPAAAAAGVRGGTEPLWVGPSDGVQVRVDVPSGRPPAGLRVDLVDPGSSGYDAVAGSDRAPAARAAAAAAEPRVLSRRQWGADESLVRSAPTYMTTVRAGVLHHTADRNGYSAAQVPAIIRADYAYHVRGRGWNDIGYNALVDRFGRTWEGRAGGLTKNVMGAHAGGFNTDTFGVAVIGNYDVTRPSAAAVAAVSRFMAWKLDLNHLNPRGRTRLTSAGGGTSRYPAGATVTKDVILGHRDVGRTACPGRYLHPLLPRIRATVAGLIGAGLADPALPRAEVAVGAGASITATALVRQDWTLEVTAACGGTRVARVSGRAAPGARITARWNGRTADGALARPGRYDLRLTSRPAGTSGRAARPLTTSVLVLPAATPDPVPTATVGTDAGGFVPVTPARVLDTRTTSSGLGPGGRVDVPVLGRAGVPADGVTSVVLNVSALCTARSTALTAWAAGTPRTYRAATSVRGGRPAAILLTVPVGAGGAVSLGNSRGVTELAVDVVGYHVAGAGDPVGVIAPSRLYDSAGDPRGATVRAGETRLITLPTTIGGVPTSSVAAVLADVSALGARAAGRLTVSRPGQTGLPVTLPVIAGEDTDGLAVLPVTDRTVAVTAAGADVRVLIDARALAAPAAAWPSGGSLTTGPGPGEPRPGRFTAVAPRRVLDTRTDGGGLVRGAPRRVVVAGGATGVPADAAGVLVDLTALAPEVATSLQASAWPAPPAGGSALRVPAGVVRSTLVPVQVGADGAIWVANARGAVEVLADVYGYWTAD